MSKRWLLTLLPCFVLYQSYLISQSKERHEEVNQRTRDFIVNYLEACAHPEFEQRMKPFLIDSSFIADYKVFRAAFEDFDYTIKHITIDGQKGMVWIMMNGTFVSEFNDFDLKKIPPTYKPVSWEEVWYFSTPDGKKFGAEFDFMHNHLQRFNALGIDCIPEHLKN